VTFPMMVSKGRVLLWSAAFVLLWAGPAHAADFSGPVVSVLDGDTIDTPAVPIPHQKCTSRHLLAHRTI
jgi:hypothetical protein